MKILLLLTALIMQNLAAQEKTTTIYLLRHAEKADASADTSLSEAGLARAARWTDYFREIPIDLIYSTPYKRTQQTCAGIASSHKIQVAAYDPKAMDLKQLADEHQGQTILIAGHSNTIPKYLNALLAQQKYPDIEESEFGNLYVLKIQNGKISDTLLHP